MASHRKDCTMATCPVSASIYGYQPSIPANAFFLAAFAVLALANLAQGIRWRTWFFSTVMLLGCVGEAVGYVGRLILHGDVFGNVGFEMQICTLIFSPAFIAAGIYFTLRQLVLIHGASFSLLRPQYYTYIFIASDFLALLFQAIGGGLASSAKTDATQQAGTNIMLTGITLQVVSLLIFAGFCGEYFLRVRSNAGNLNPATAELRASRKFRIFLGALVFSFLTLFVRCVYRIPELSGGWRNPVMQNEREFIVLDGVMVVLAVLALTVLHPGYCLRDERIREVSKDRMGSDSDLEAEKGGAPRG